VRISIALTVSLGSTIRYANKLGLSPAGVCKSSMCEGIAYGGVSQSEASCSPTALAHEAAPGQRPRMRRGHADRLFGAHRLAHS
jgi:hypothetical protein